MPVQLAFKAGSDFRMIFSSKASTLFILVKLVNVKVSISFFITVFSNTVSKSVNMYTEKVSVGREGSIQRRTRHKT